MDTDVNTRDQDSKPKLSSADAAALAAKTAANRQQEAVTSSDTTSHASDVSSSSIEAPEPPLKPFRKVAKHKSSHSGSLALIYVATAVASLLFIWACGPMVNPRAFEKDITGLARGLKHWSPLPQAALLILLFSLSTAANKLKTGHAQGVPDGCTVNTDNQLCDNSGSPLPRDLRLLPDGKTVVVGSAGRPFPKGCMLGPGGVLVQAANGRAIPHCCSVGEHGELLSSAGQPLPDSMMVGPNSTLIAADGTVLSPDLQPVPSGFTLSGCGQFLLRPNGKPVPRGVHVGPGFRLLKPNGDFLPDGVKIGPNGSIICLDGTILGTDGHPVPQGFALSPDKTSILDPDRNPISNDFDIGSNGTLIGPQGQLVTATGCFQLCEHFSLGPLGNLIMRGKQVPAAATFDDRGQLVMPSGEVLNCVHE